jgi:hypothetical protein
VTDVEGSTLLWAVEADAKDRAMLHNGILHSTIEGLVVPAI